MSSKFYRLSNLSPTNVACLISICMFIILITVFKVACNRSSDNIQDPGELKIRASEVIKLFKDSDFTKEEDRKAYLDIVKEYVEDTYTRELNIKSAPMWFRFQLDVFRSYQIEYSDY